MSLQVLLNQLLKDEAFAKVVKLWSIGQFSTLFYIKIFSYFSLINYKFFNNFVIFMKFAYKLISF
jgi:hypothetical protein